MLDKKKLSGILSPEDASEFGRLRVKWGKKGLTFEEALSLRDLEDVVEKAFPELERFTPHKNWRDDNVKGKSS